VLENLSQVGEKLTSLIAWTSKWPIKSKGIKWMKQKRKT